MKPKLQENFRQLARDASALYVTPLYNNMDSRIDENAGFDVMRWEVQGHA